MVNNNNNNNMHYLERIGSGGAGIHPFLQLLDSLNRILCDPKINAYFGSKSKHFLQKNQARLTALTLLLKTFK